MPSTPHEAFSFRHRSAVLLLAWLALVAGCATPAAPTPSVRAALAPTGALRVAVYSGSPSSIVDETTTPRGVGYDLGRELARRLGVPFAPVVFANNALALAAVKDAKADVTFTNASPERARDLDFSPTFMDVGKSFLVTAASPLATQADFAKPGLRIGVSRGSSTASELAPLFPAAVLVPVPVLKDVDGLLARGDLDAFATNEAILFELSDALPGSRVVPGRWGMEHFAAGIPKGRAAASPDAAAWLARFIGQARDDGTVAAAIARAGLRGTVAPE